MAASVIGRLALVVGSAVTVVLGATIWSNLDGPAPAASPPACRLGVPAYVTPTELAGASGAAVVILNPADGADVERDDDLAHASASLAATTQVLGYVKTGYGTRAVAGMLTEVDRYLEWYDVDGIFLDEVSSDRAHLAGYRSLVSKVRAHGAGIVALNPGVYPDAGYVPLADVIVTFEGTAADYPTMRRPEQFTAHEWHLIHTASAAQVAGMVRLAASRGVQYVYVTDRSEDGATWNALPPYLADERRAVSRYCKT